MYLQTQKMTQNKKLAKYKHNFKLWLVERWGLKMETVLWSAYGGDYAGHQWDGTPDPFNEVVRAIENRQWVGVESGTGVGKTFIIALVVYWFLDTWGGTVITTAPTKEQLSNVLWSEISGGFHKFQRLRPQAEMFSLRIFPDGKLREKKLLKDDEEMKKQKITKMVGIVGKKRAGEESSVSFQGYHDDPMLIVIDEAAGIEPSVMTAAKNTASDPDNNFIVAMGNPDSMTDQLHQFCEMENVVHVRISAKDHPNVVLKRKVIPGAVTQASIDIRAKEYGEESPMYQSRVEGKSPSQGVGSLFNLKWLERMISPDHEPEDDGSYHAVGVDAANSLSGDMAALVWGKKNVIDRLQEFPCPDASHLGLNLIMDPLELAENKYHDYSTPTIYDYNIFPQCVGVDGVGIGVSTVQALWNKQCQVVSLIAGEKQLEKAILLDAEKKPIFKFENLRGQMYWEAARDLEKGNIKCIVTDKLILKKLFRELMAHKYSTKGGKTRVLSKDDVKELLNGKSPNLSDAFVYWNWVRKGHYMGPEYIPL